MLFVGIDIAKHKHDIAILDDSGEILKAHMRIQNNRNGYMTLHQTLKKLRQTLNAEVLLAMEDTGIYSMNLLQFLQSKHYMVYTYNPLLIKEFAKATSLRQTKTDKKDALTIANRCYLDRKASLPKIDPVMVSLKHLTRHRSRTGKIQARLKTQYTRLLDLTFPELSVHLSTSSIHLKYVYAMLTAYPSVTHLADAHLTRLTTIIKKASKGRIGKSRAIELRDLARTSIGTVSDSLAFELRHLIQSIQFYEQILNETDEKIGSIMTDIQSPVLTIPGISHRLGSIILAEIRGIEYFQNPAQLLAYCGLEPSVNQSGTFSGQGKMVKRGSPYLRWAILQAARLIAINSPVFKIYLLKKLEEGKHYNVALSHVAKKLIRVLFYLLKSNQSFDESKLA